MKNWILSLKIRAKLLAAFGSILLFSILLILLSVSSINRVIKNKAINEKIEMLKRSAESQEFAIKEFTYEGYKEKNFQEFNKSTFVVSYDLNFRKAVSILNELEDNFKDSTTIQNTVGDINQSLMIIHSEFDSLKNYLKERGFKDYGLEGSLRKAVHQIENSNVNFDKAQLLTLRRNEKDFFLRRDLKYRDDFIKNAEIFIASVSKTKSPSVIMVLENLANYKAEFLKVIDLEIKIGLKTDEGIRGKLKDQLEALKVPLESFSSTLKAKSENQITEIMIVLWVIFAVQFIAGIFLAIFYANLITKAIKEIRNAMQTLASGTFPEKLTIKTTEEIGQTKMALNLFLERLQAATGFAHRMGDGELTAKYDSRFDNDVMAISIIQMQKKLKEADERQSKINWVNKGAAQFSEIIKNEAEDISSLGDKILSSLVKYLNVNQGALFIIQEQRLVRVSSYAYGKKKFLAESIELGQGLVGQCALERQTIYLKQIPTDYIKITSGLGEATPNNVIIIPIKLRDQILGVLELASFTILESFKVEFVERISENIASLIFNKQNVSQTQRLLKESQERAEILTQQEEEMRQNSEELQATQEEMMRQKTELEREIEILRHRLKTSHELTYA